VDIAGSTDGERRNACMLLVRKPERKRLLGTQRCRWVDNIDFGVKEICFGCVDWLGLIQDRDQSRTFGFHKMLGSF
jgi:hypothetical protein